MTLTPASSTDASPQVFPYVGPIAGASIYTTAAVAAPECAWGTRVHVPRSGTLISLAVYVGVSAGNIDVGVYTTAEPRARLYSTGSAACPAAGAWRVVGTPNLFVRQGEQYDFVLAASDGTATFGHTQNSAAAAQQQLPANYLAGGTPLLAWMSLGDQFILPATIAEAAVSAWPGPLCMIGRIG